MKCLLCKTDATHFYSRNNRAFYSCKKCLGISLHPLHFISENEELKRYMQHNNHVNDIGYQNFSMPVVNQVVGSFSKKDKGLDFGCGPGPVITKMLRDLNYSVTTYDPYFDNNPLALKQLYNYIICCEVVEHFNNPLPEFELLHSLLQANGQLICKTELYTDNTNFENWYYKNDATHVFFYHKKTFEWIKKELHFSTLHFKNGLIILEK